jgi:hypothetical protein
MDFYGSSKRLASVNCSVISQRFCGDSLERFRISFAVILKRFRGDYEAIIDQWFRSGFAVIPWSASASVLQWFWSDFAAITKRLRSDYCSVISQRFWSASAATSQSIPKRFRGEGDGYAPFT